MAASEKSESSIEILEINESPSTRDQSEDPSADEPAAPRVYTDEDYLSPLLPLHQRIICATALWAIKIYINFLFWLAYKNDPVHQKCKPTFIKAYPIRRSLQNRFFIPNSYVPGESKLLPLYIDVHGSGFAVFTPEIDDEFCHWLANEHNILVVAVNYRKAPWNIFPCAVHDVAAIAGAVIDDESLPIDKSRIAIGGFSAGGNLALTALQLPELKGRVKAALPVYPVTDLSIVWRYKLKVRPYKNEGDVDKMATTGPLFQWGYLRDGIDVRNPLISPIYAPKEDFPDWVFVIGAEHDGLMMEARDFMFKLADITEPTEEENYEFETEKGMLKWHLYRDQEHAFTYRMYAEGPADAPRKKAELEAFEEMGEWLMAGPFAE